MWSFATTYDPFSTPSSTFGRHDVFETMRLGHTFLCPKTLGSSSSFDSRSFGSQCLFDAVARCTTDCTQGGRFTRCNGSRCQECQERKESTSLWSFATTYDPFSTSSTFGRHDVFETMKGTRCRHAPLGFFLSPPPLAARPPPPPPPLPSPDPDCGEPGEETNSDGTSILVLLHDIVGQRLDLLNQSRKVRVVIWNHGIRPHRLPRLAIEDLKQDDLILSRHIRKTNFTELSKDNERAFFRRLGCWRAHVCLPNVLPCPTTIESLLESTSRYME